MVPLVFKYSIKFNFASHKSMNLSKNYYNILEIGKNADKKTIKKSYLKLVKIYHPDVNPKGKAKFTDIQEAFQILSHEQSKIYYDNNVYNNESCRQKTGNDKEYKNSYNSDNFNRRQYERYSYKKSENAKYSDFYTNYQQNSNRYKNQQQRNTQNKNSKTYYNDQQYQSKFSNNESYSQSQYKQQHQQRQSSSDQKSQFRQCYNQRQNSNRQEFYNSCSEQNQQSSQQLKMRDKLRAMKGLTSYYSMFWKKNQVRYKDVMNKGKNVLGDEQQPQAQSDQDKKLKKLVPQKLQKFYQKMIQKMQDINYYSSNSKLHK